MSIRVCSVGGGSLTMRLGAGKGEVVLEVADTGEGIPEADRERVFDFAYSTREGGHGLGLAMVHGFVHQSGGFIELDSTLTEGTKLRVSFPAVDAPANAAEDAAPDGELPGGSESVLVVEDDELVRNVVVRVLRSCGYGVVEAGNGIEALRAIEDQPPLDLLLSDVALPGMSGVELTAHVRERYPDVRVCLMSGYPRSDADRDEVLAASDRFVAKPITPQMLATAVREALA